MIIIKVNLICNLYSEYDCKVYDIDKKTCIQYDHDCYLRF